MVKVPLSHPLVVVWPSLLLFMWKWNVHLSRENEYIYNSTCMGHHFLEFDLELLNPNYVEAWFWSLFFVCIISIFKT